MAVFIGKVFLGAGMALLLRVWLGRFRSERARFQNLAAALGCWVGLLVWLGLWSMAFGWPLTPVFWLVNALGGPSGARWATGAHLTLLVLAMGTGAAVLLAPRWFPHLLSRLFAATLALGALAFLTGMFFHV